MAVNPQFCYEKYRQWVDLLAPNFVKNRQRRPEDPIVAYRLDEGEGDRFPELKVETDTSDDEHGVIVKGRYDGSITLDVVLSGFEPKVSPLTQGEEGKGLAHLGDLRHIEHVVVVGPFSSGTSAMCEYLEKYFDVVVHPPHWPLSATGWIGDMSEADYVPRQNHWQVGWKRMPPLNAEASTKMFPSISLLIQIIREPLAWIKSMVTSSYSMKSAEGMQKGRGRWTWLTQGVKVDSEENI